MTKIRIYTAIDQILKKQGVYDFFGSYKNTVDAIVADVLSDTNFALNGFLAQAINKRTKNANCHFVRISTQTERCIESSHYLELGISKTTLINAIILAYLAKKIQKNHHDNQTSHPTKLV